MTKPNDPAFPTETHAILDGLTKREYFAGLAMQGLCADTNYDGDVAASSVKLADALIAELNKNAPS